MNSLANQFPETQAPANHAGHDVRHPVTRIPGPDSMTTGELVGIAMQTPQAHRVKRSVTGPLQGCQERLHPVAMRHTADELPCAVVDPLVSGQGLLV